jgi:hypothetical protein
MTIQGKSRLRVRKNGQIRHNQTARKESRRHHPTLIRKSRHDLGAGS